MHLFTVGDLMAVTQSASGINDLYALTDPATPLFVKLQHKRRGMRWTGRRVRRMADGTLYVIIDGELYGFDDAATSALLAELE